MSAQGGVEDFSLRAEALECPAAKRLIAELNAELSGRYPEPGATHFRLEASELREDNGVFLIGYVGQDACACGAMRRIAPGVAELKRMYVQPQRRGRGLARRLLQALEEAARARGIQRLVLETGTRQAEALALYRRAGFYPIERFGEYVDSPLSLCMAKDLLASPDSAAEP